MPSQGLADLLSGAAGAPVDRPALNAFVATSQARNGLVSAQTQDAMIKAQQGQEDLDADAGIDSQLADIYPNMRPSERALAKAALIGALGNDRHTALKALGALKLGYGAPTDQTAGQQMVEGKLAGPVAVPGNFVSPPGSALSSAPVQQTPEAAAQTSNFQAESLLHNRQANDPQLFHGGGGAAMDPQAIAFGAYQLYKTGKMPALGMGNGSARSAMLAQAAQLAQREANGEAISNPGFDTAIANGQDFTAAGRALNNYAGGPISGQVRSINNVVGHLQLMEQLFSGLQNGDVQVVNKLTSQWKKAFGSEVPTDIQTAAGFIGPELTKILSANNSAGTAEERQEFAHTAANLANAPEQTAGALSTLKNMLGRQMTDLALQYHGATGRSDFSRRYVAPDVAQYLEINPDGGSPQNSTVTPPATSPTASASPARGAATVLPPQALSQLKEGFHTTFGNGQIWTLQNGKPVQVK